MLMLIIAVYMGLRPISGVYFGDTSNYAWSFSRMQANLTPLQWEDPASGEWFFGSWMKLFATYSDVHMFFLSCAVVYMSTLWYAMVRFFGNKCYIPFLVAMSMFTFWSYGVNGIRNGLASSIVILALSFRPRFYITAVLCFIALGIHKSLTLTIGAATLAYFVRNPKIYLSGWFLSILISAIGGNALANSLMSSGFIENDRFEGYLSKTPSAESFSSTGFRWDFLLYSAMPVVVGYYFIFKRKYDDTIYTWLFNIYLTANAFWIIVIQASFSNRFAQISWFIMPLVLIYPYIKGNWGDNHSRMTANAIVIFYLFTFYSHILTKLF